MKGAATASSSNDQEMKPGSTVVVQKQKCPRCDSSNTKFCYYNNYSISQPRYFCKSCRRYWTHGGTLRNVPIGGGSRKSKRPKMIIPFSSSSPAALNPLPTSAPGLDTGYLPSLEAIHSTLNQTAAPQILTNQSSSVADVGVYSFGLSEQNWAHRSFGDGVHNPAWTTINNPIHSSSSGNNVNNSSVESENNCCNLVPNHHLPPYPHPP